MNRYYVWGLGAVLALGSWAGAAQITLEGLLGEMTDLEALTTVSSPAFTCKQFSSYDRASTDPDVATDANWFANGDRGHHLRSENRNGEIEWVMMDAEGPGAIVRIWSANPEDAGVLRVYIDGAADPVIEMPLTDLLSGTVFPFVNPIAGERGRGWNSHFPIMYAKHCKVTASKRDFYYHVNYRTYESGTAMEPYTPGQAEAHRSAIHAVAERLRNPNPTETSGNSDVARADLALADGASEELTIAGARAIHRLTMRVDAADVEKTLRACWLEIKFDGQDRAAVAAPLGDFFGTAPGLNPYESLTCGVLPSGELYSNWIMPFREAARIRVTNHSGHPVTVHVAAHSRPRAWSDDSLYFHAAWKAEFGISTIPRQDWNYIEIDGAGHFVGNSLQVTNPTPAWWGEGDEKIYVDHEDFPSTFGTGTEDYYGYAWCAPDLFVHAYHNQPRCDGPGNYGYTSVNRFHVIDRIPFTEAFRFDMEIWHWADVKVDYATTSYWYAAPGSTDNRPAVDAALLRIDEVPEMEGVEGAIEGELMEVASISEGGAEPQGGVAWNWSRGRQLWWTGASEGAELVLEFPVETAGLYEVVTILTRARDYGIVTLAINNAEPTPPIDLYNRSVETTPEISLGTHTLDAGANRITIRIVGANPQADPAYMFGIDYVKLLTK